jgi:hypothetical protein
MSYPINYPTPQGANFQAFYGGGTKQDWVKPQGASMVRMLIIGAGGNGGNGDTTNGGAGGGSGVVTSWIGPAMFVPDVLRVEVGQAGGATQGSGASWIYYQGPKNSGGYALIYAYGGESASSATQGYGGTALTYEPFCASGIFSSIAGQDGAAVGANLAASTTTFLSGGAGGASTTTGAGGTVGGKYGYPTLSGGTTGAVGNTGRNGYFLFQPILVSFGGTGGGGGSGTTGGTGGAGGIGCGGGGGGACSSGNAPGGQGGDGAVFIWSW